MGVDELWPTMRPVWIEKHNDAVDAKDERTAAVGVVARQVWMALYQRKTVPRWRNPRRGALLPVVPSELQMSRSREGDAEHAV